MRATLSSAHGGPVVVKNHKGPAGAKQKLVLQKGQINFNKLAEQKELGRNSESPRIFEVLSKANKHRRQPKSS